MGDLTADLRLDIGAETSAILVYENLMNFTDDVLVKESLRFLMTREVAHFQMFQAALDSIQPNFPPGILQSDPKFSNKYFNMSQGNDYLGGWNVGSSIELGEKWQVIENPLQHVIETNGLLEEIADGTDRTENSVQKLNKALSAERKSEVDDATMPSNGFISWSDYDSEAVLQETDPRKSNGKNRK